MTPLAPESLVAAISELDLLEAEQVQELRDKLLPLGLDARGLAELLLARSWLTAYQADMLLAGRGADLIVGGFRLLAPLGEGGMGQVFKAEQRRLGRVVALKLIHHEYLKDRPEAVRRFQREARAAAQLSHPNTIRIYDADQDGKRHFIVMEYVDGLDVARLVERGGPLPIAVACDYIAQAALGLQHAHELGLIHRDVKPSNLLVTRSPVSATKHTSGVLRRGRGTTEGKGLAPVAPDALFWELRSGGVVKLLDMGLARVMQAIEAESGNLTIEGNVMGTPDYIAPEQARDPHNVDGRADIYSLGCAFYYALAGRPPFPKSSALEKLLMQQLDQPPPVASVRPGVPDEVAAVLNKMLAKSPSERPQSALEVYEALTALLPKLPVPVDEEPLHPVKMSGVDITPVCQVGPVVVGQPTPRNLTSERTPPASVPPAHSAPDWPSQGQISLAQQQEGQGDAPADDSPWPELSEPALRSLSEAPRAEPPRLWDPPEKRPAGDSTVDGSIETPRTVDRMIGAGWANASLAQTGGSSPAADTVFDGGPRPPEPPLLVLIEVHKGCVVSLAYSRDGRTLASGGTDGSVHVWNIDGNSLRELAVLSSRGEEVRALALSPTGTILAYGTIRGNIWIWDLTAKPPQPIEVFQGSRDRILCMAFSPDGHTLAFGANKTVRIYDVAPGKVKKRAELSGHNNDVLTLMFSPDGKRLASAGQDENVCLWNPTRFWSKLQGHVAAPNVTALAFSEDGRHFAYGGRDRSFFVCEVSDEGPRPFARYTNCHGGLQIMQFEADGTAILTIEDQGHAGVRDLGTGEYIIHWRLPYIKAYCFALSPQSLWLGVGNTDGSIALYDMNR
ncbi:MAG TPA: protein kinase [Gemmatales bacterium]|nr:protein kinase [Gemmatales bacterium]